MMLRTWDIVVLQVDDRDAAGHPAVVLGSFDQLASPRMERINVLFGTKKQPAESAAEHQVILNGADGLEFPTLLDCSFIYTARRSRILGSAGYVSFKRRKQIQRKVRAFLGLG